MSGDSGRQRWVGWERKRRKRRKKAGSSLFSICCLWDLQWEVLIRCGNRVLGLRVRDGLCLFCTQLTAETTGVSELSHGGEHRRGGCKGEKRLHRRVGLSFIWSWLQGEPRSGGQEEEESRGKRLSRVCLLRRQ